MKPRSYGLLFMFNAAGMILELLASRVMSPYFGNSNYVWTAVIGIILLAGSIGNIAGGRLCLKKNRRTVLACILCACGAYISLIPVLSQWMLPLLKQPGTEIRAASVAASVILFLIPSAGLGMLTPVVMKDLIDASPDSGHESGRIHAVIAIGSLAGTFAGGFILIPFGGTSFLLGVLGAACAVLGFFLADFGNIRALAVMTFFTVMSVTSAINTGSDSDSGSWVASIDTEYGRIIIEDTEYGGEPVRLYRQSGAYSSATYLDGKKKYDLVFGYMGRYEEAQKYLDVKDTLMIGGAAYQYPKYFISRHPGQRMEVVEIDGMAEKIAREYFFLDDLISEYHTDETGALKLVTGDGRVYLAGSGRKYDAVFNDAFSGQIPVGTLATVEAAQLIKDSLNPGGVYMSNVIGSIEGPGGRFLRSEVRTLRQVFAHVEVMLTREGTGTETCNYMIIASDAEYPWEGLVAVDASDGIILTDDYCPVDSLVGTLNS